MEGQSQSLHCEPGSGLFEKGQAAQALGGANVLSRMSYGKSALPSTTKQLNVIFPVCLDHNDVKEYKVKEPIAKNCVV